MAFYCEQCVSLPSTGRYPRSCRARYESEGWWTKDTLGSLLTAALKARPDAGFRVHSDRPSLHRHIRRCRARGAAAGGRSAVARGGAGRRRRVPVAELDGGSGDVLGVGAARRRRRSDRALLRPEGSRLHPDGRPTQGVHHHRAVRPDDATIRISAPTCRSSAWSVAISTTCWPTNPCRAPSTPTRQAPALIAFTSGTTRDPKGVVHSHQTLGCEIRQLNAGHPEHPAGTGDGAAGRALHRHARRVAVPGARGRADPPVRRVGSRSRTEADEA